MNVNTNAKFTRRRYWMKLKRRITQICITKVCVYCVVPENVCEDVYRGKLVMRGKYFNVNNYGNMCFSVIFL